MPSFIPREKALKLLRLQEPFTATKLEEAYQTRLNNIHDDFKAQLHDAYATLLEELQKPKPSEPISRPVPPVEAVQEVRSFFFQHKGVLIALSLFLFAGLFYIWPAAKESFKSPTPNKTASSKSKDKPSKQQSSTPKNAKSAKGSNILESVFGEKYAEILRLKASLPIGPNGIVYSDLKMLIMPGSNAPFVKSYIPGNSTIYKYKIENYSASELDKSLLRKAQRTLEMKGRCKDTFAKTYFPIETHFSDKSGRFFLSVTSTWGDCLLEYYR